MDEKFTVKQRIDGNYEITLHGNREPLSELEIKNRKIKELESFINIHKRTLSIQEGIRLFGLTKEERLSKISVLEKEIEVLKNE